MRIEPTEVHEFDEPILSKDDRYTIISDLHLLDGSKADNSIPATEALVNVLVKAKTENRKLILNGDIIEAWQLEGLDGLARIFSFNSQILLRIRPILDTWIVGNHDHVMLSVQAGQMLGHAIGAAPVPMNAMTVALHRGQVYVEHGHQVDPLNSGGGMWIGKFLTGIWGGLERIFAKREKSPRIRSFQRAMKTQDGLMKYGSASLRAAAGRLDPELYERRARFHHLKRGIRVYVYGHTHRASMTLSPCPLEEDRLLIVNDGCFVDDSNSYNFVEIDQKEVRLMKWSIG